MSAPTETRSPTMDWVNPLTAIGRGFVILRGIDANDPEILRRMFGILGNHPGTPVMQYARGQIRSEVATASQAHDAAPIHAATKATTNSDFTAKAEIASASAVFAHRRPLERAASRSLAPMLSNLLPWRLRLSTALDFAPASNPMNGE